MKKRKKYIYPKVGSGDFLWFRMGGAGLGNLLFTYAEALVLSKKYEIDLIWPTWGTIPLTRKLFYILGRYNRTYFNIFENNSKYIDGFRKAKILLTNKKIINPKDIKKIEAGIIVIDKNPIKFTGKLYEGLRLYREWIYDDLYRNLSKKNQLRIDNININDGFVVQIRMDDFKKVSLEQLKQGEDNVRIPLEWFENIIKQIRKIVNKNVKVYLMSDGSDRALQSIFKLGNVERFDLDNSICNILAMAKAKLMVVSGSTYSLWARFLGQMSSIAFKNQYKEKVLYDDKNKFEIDIEEKIEEKYYSILRSYFS